jgi:cold shock CspA family protein
MESPTEIVYRHMESSPALEARVQEHVAHLEHLHPRIVHCRVVIEAPHRRHRRGKLYRVSIRLDIPGKNIAVGREGRLDHAHEDVYVALRDAFDAAARRLQDRARIMRGKVKHHEAGPHGTVARMVPEEDHGFIALSDGREIYFHRNSVTDGGYDSLEVGSEVRVTVATGDSPHGPHASTVQPVGKHHIPAERP